MLLLIPILFSFALVELALKKLKPIIKYYENKPREGDVMRRWDINKWSRVRLYLGSILLLPRLGLIILSVIAHWIGTRISMLGYTYTALPIPYWRRVLFTISSRVWARVLLFGIGFWKITIIGDPKDCAVIASNHCSWVDIIYFLTSPELPSFVSKASVKNFPLVGTIATAMQCIFIERTKDKISAIKAIHERQKEIYKGFPKLLVFPEGTTTNGTGLMEFKRGGFIGMLPVQPVCLSYEEGYFSPTMEIVPMWVHAIMLASQFSNKLTVTRLPVCNPLPDHTPELYAEFVRGKIADHLGIAKVAFKLEQKIELLDKIFNEKSKEF